MEKMMLYKTFFNGDYGSDSWWVFFDDEKDKLTGRWRIDGDCLLIEISYRYEVGVFRKKWKESTKWYSDDQIKFIFENGGQDDYC